MWGMIFGALALGSVLGILYLISRFARFRIVQKATKGKKIFGFLTGLVPVLAIALGTGAALGEINAAIVILHLVAFWLLCDAVSKITEKVRGKKFTRYYAGIFAILITAVYLAWGWYLANHVWRKEYVLETDKQVGNLRIVLFADSHVGNTFSGEGFIKWVDRMQAEEPDIVVIAGDYVDDDTSKEDMIAACRALGTLETTYGVYYAFGNHDKGYYGSAYRGYSGDDLVAELEKNGVRVLQDDIVTLDDRFSAGPRGYVRTAPGLPRRPPGHRSHGADGPGRCCTSPDLSPQSAQPWRPWAFPAGPPNGPGARSLWDGGSGRVLKFIRAEQMRKGY